MNVFLNRLDHKVKVFNLAVDAYAGKKYFFQNVENNSGTWSSTPLTSSHISSMTDSLDNMFTGIPISYIKIDVEGDELGILSSSDLEKYRPYIFIIETIEYKDRVTLNNKRNINYEQKTYNC